MSYGGLSKAAEGCARLSDTTALVQMVKTLGEINLVLGNFELYGNWDKKLAADANKIFADATDLDQPGEVAVDQTNKETDTIRSDQANGMMNTLVEGRKQVLALFGSNLSSSLFNA